MILTRVGWLASFVQIVGGCYLIYLGLMAWLSDGAKSTVQQQAGSGSLKRGFLMGALVNLSDPMVASCSKLSGTDSRSCCWQVA